ncbi:hypothetical protein E2562_008175 [Oryza meyeriana var. granulata]|uniref:Uncharacterized protein n=1 Tax=Oryza meyeriana var. granulata TaxID=110450 RepID=A0A6G1CEL7_9ORYZ|nr:hypothetical protein E2562_008175 [Oryza meyeriana var. granulata]
MPLVLSFSSNSSVLACCCTRSGWKEVLILTVETEARAVAIMRRQRRMQVRTLHPNQFDAGTSARLALLSPSLSRTSTYSSLL